MTGGPWAPLRAELSAFRKSGRRLPLWWRDDDATEPTMQLDRLQSLAEHAALPVHLAVVPALAQPALSPRLAGGAFRAVVHGWRHENHAPADRKSSEFGTPRAGAPEDARRGLQRLSALFGPHVFPMFVPPWNRIDDGLVPELPAIGYRALSTFGPRAAPFAAPGLAAINTHVDPVDWRGGRGLADPEGLVDRLVTHLRSRRSGEADAAEPLGLLTHHLVMGDATWDFCRALLCELREGPIDLFDIATAKEMP